MSELLPRKRITKEEAELNAKAGLRGPNHAEALANPINPASEKAREQKKQEFKPAEFRKFVNRRVDALKEEIYARGLAPSEVSKTWLPIRLGLDGVEKKLLAYREISDPAERARLENEIRSDFAQIEGEKFDNLYENTQEKMRQKPRSKGEVRPELPKNFDSVLKNAASAEAREFRERELDTIANLRAQIQYLEEKSKPGRSALKTDYEERIVNLEKELRRHERLAKGELPAGTRSGKPPEKAEAERVTDVQKSTPLPTESKPEDIDYGAKLDLEFPKVNAAQPGSPETPTAPETVAEGKTALRRSVGELQDLLAERAGVKGERDAMNAAGQKYFEAYKELHREGVEKSRNIGAVVMRERAKKLEEEYGRARIAYAERLKGSMEERIANKHLGPEKSRALQERYDRAIRAKAIFNEVIRPSTELKNRARVEGLNEKGQGAFVRAFAWFGAKNKELEERFGKTGAIAIRTLISAAAVTVPAGLLGAFGTAGIMAIAGYGAIRAGRAFGSALLGSGISEGIFGAHERLSGRAKRENARAQLETEGKGILSGFTEEQLASIDANRERLEKEGDEAGAMRKKAIIKALTSLGIGGLSYGLAELSSLHDAAGVITQTPGLRPSIPQDHGMTDAQTLPKAPSPVESVSADHGDGGIRLLKHLHAKLEHDGVASDKPALARLYNTDPEKLAKQLGLYKPGAAGGLENIEVPKGSTLAYTSSGEVVLTLKGGDSVTLIDAAGHFPHHHDDIGRFIDLHHAAHAAEAPNATAQIDHGDTDSNALNEWASSHPGQTPPSDLLRHAGEAMPQAPAASGADSAAGFKTLQDFVNAPKPAAPQGYEAATVSAPTPSDGEVRTLGDFVNMHESVLDPAAAHVYESVKGEYLFGGSGKLDDAAQQYAYEHHASVFVNDSYDDPLHGRVVNVKEFRPFGGDGKALPPVIHTEPSFDLDPTKDFTKRIH